MMLFNNSRRERERSGNLAGDSDNQAVTSYIRRRLPPEILTNSAISVFIAGLGLQRARMVIPTVRSQTGISMGNPLSRLLCISQ